MHTEQNLKKVKTNDKKTIKKLTKLYYWRRGLFGPDEAIILDFAEAVQKAVSIETLDVVQQALESAKQHILLKNQALLS